jgi:hypothetical protein
MLMKVQQIAAKDLTFKGNADLRYWCQCECVSFVFLFFL